MLLVESDGSSDEDDDEDTRDLEGRTTTSEGMEVKFYFFSFVVLFDETFCFSNKLTVTSWNFIDFIEF